LGRLEFWFSIRRVALWAKTNWILRLKPSDSKRVFSVVGLSLPRVIPIALSFDLDYVTLCSCERYIHCTQCPYSRGFEQESAFADYCRGGYYYPFSNWEIVCIASRWLTINIISLKERLPRLWYFSLEKNPISDDNFRRCRPSQKFLLTA
jgi:hypothetical protein